MNHENNITVVTRSGSPQPGDEAFEEAVPSAELRLQGWLAEFQQLRHEINNRSQLQGALVGLNIASFGVVGGLVVGETIGVGAALGFSISSPLLGLMYLNHDESIHRIGDYIRDRIQPKVASITRQPDVLKWEHEVRKVPLSRPELVQNVAIALFTIPALFGLILGGIELASDVNGPLVVGIVFGVLALFVYAYRQGKYLAQTHRVETIAARAERGA